jgi:hypothetical protein
MGILGFFKLVADICRAAYLAVRNRPGVTCDKISAYKAIWYPDSIPDEQGNVVAEGIAIELVVSFMLTNNGPVDTTLKDTYVVVKHGKKKLGRLTHISSQYYMGHIHEIQIEPRKAWGYLWLKLYGFLEGITEPPEDLKAELVIEVVAQQPVKKKINLYF